MAIVFRRKATVMMKLTEAEHTKLSAVGWDSLAVFRRGKGDYTNWFNLAFRLRFGLNLANEYYEDVTALEIKLCYDKAIGIINRPDAKPGAPLYMTEEEFDSVTSGLEALDVMQREMLRRDMAPILRNAAVYMRARYVADRSAQPLTPKRIR